MAIIIIFRLISLKILDYLISDCLHELVTNIIGRIPLTLVAFNNDFSLIRHDHTPSGTGWRINFVYFQF
ncbi:MAG: hypothetical protein ABI203_02805 [Mucilaginibacter sp.]